MARQVVQINVVQDSSGTGVRVSTAWTSDGTTVSATKLYRRHTGAYTLDRALVDELQKSALEAVDAALAQQQLL